MTFITNSAGLLLCTIGLFINAVPTTAPERVYIYRVPLVQFSCTPQGEREYKWICAERKKMERVIKHG